MTSVGHEDIIADLCESADQLYSHADDLPKRHHEEVFRVIDIAIYQL